MHRYIPVIALLLALGASTTPAQAHVPAVGDRAWFTMLCREEAHDVLIELAREKGLSFVENRLRRFVNGYQCFPQALPVPGHIVAVADPVHTPNGRLVLHPMTVQLEGGDASEVWFTVHSEEAEGEGA